MGPIMGISDNPGMGTFERKMPGLLVKGAPRKYARSRHNRARINPIATWDCFKVILLNATIAATSTPY